MLGSPVLPKKQKKKPAVLAYIANKSRMQVSTRVFSPVCLKTNRKETHCTENKDLEDILSGITALDEIFHYNRSLDL